MVCEWIVDHQEDLFDNWNLMQEGKKLFKVPGADQ